MATSDRLPSNEGRFSLAGGLPFYEITVPCVVLLLQWRPP